ncbi:MAG: NERD domain-containing protein [Proteobacteria bacterium]|nr:NERD domain-containing protein [Pseudomonadota bacterium]NOG60059.1 NERD domain-containing protein [Pseudomonadota bacterium]
MAVGYKVYHDVPGKKFNIDHVVVGKNGVFAIETKGRSKKNSNEGKENARVIYDGEVLNFPTWKESDPINQVKNVSVWLSKELSSAVGEEVKVESALSISGWYIDRKSNASPCVYNGKSPERIFPKLRCQELSEQLIARITHQIERMVNDVKPKAYKPKENT